MVTPFRRLFGQRDDGIADLNIGIDDFPARVRVTLQFGCAEGLFIKLNGCGCAFDKHTWGYSVEAFWYRFHIAFHTIYSSEASPASGARLNKVHPRPPKSGALLDKHSIGGDLIRT